MSNRNTWIVIILISAIAAVAVVKIFFPDMIKVVGAGITAFLVFLASRIFGKKRN